jgi:hypothetical protein
MSSKKTIEINPELFMLSPSKKKNNVKRPNMKNLIKPNSLKRQLLNKMREHSLKNRNKLDKDLQFHNEFKTHIDYLEKLGKRKTVKKNVNAHIELPDDLSQTDENSVKEPPYGCLKAGDKPTFRQWKRITQKKITNDENEIKVSLSKPEEPILLNIKKEEPSEKILPTSNYIKKFNSFESIEKPQIILNPQRKQQGKNKTIKQTYGKSGRKVSVNIKNSYTRKKIDDDCNLLKKTALHDVKKYLKNKNLIKTGSNAPPDVLRKMYMDSHLAGDIENKSITNLVHNYINDK